MDRAPWAYTSNTPFRRYKHWVHKGGIASPLVAHWPVGIRRQGQLKRTPAHLIDVMATCVDVSRAPFPDHRHGERIPAIEGRSWHPTSAETAPWASGTLRWQHDGNLAVRVGRGKLVARHGRPWELYDLDRDRTESNDLVERLPGKERDLAHLYAQWAQRCQVLPWDEVRRPSE